MLIKHTYCGRFRRLAILTAHQITCYPCSLLLRPTSRLLPPPVPALASTPPWPTRAFSGCGRTSAQVLLQMLPLLLPLPHTLTSVTLRLQRRTEKRRSLVLSSTTGESHARTHAVCLRGFKVKVVRAAGFSLNRALHMSCCE